MHSAWIRYTEYFSHVNGFDSRNVALLAVVVLTAVAGSVDAVSYLSFDRVFTSNMTGNLAVVGFGLLRPSGVALLRPALALGGFVLGVALGGWSLRTVRTEAARFSAVVRGLAVSSGVLAVVMVALFLLGVRRNQDLQVTLPSLLALAMGVQGAVVRALGIEDVPTTVVTSTLTGLVADGRFGSGTGLRWRRRAGALGAFVGGTAAGAGLTFVGPGYGLIPAVAVSLAATVTLRRCAAGSQSDAALPRRETVSTSSHTGMPGDVLLCENM